VSTGLELEPCAGKVTAGASLAVAAAGACAPCGGVSDSCAAASASALIEASAESSAMRQRLGSCV
jgi:hypothetical protein